MKVGKDGEFRSHLPSLLDGFLDCRMPCMHGPVDHAVLDGGLMDHQVRLATHLAELDQLAGGPGVPRVHHFEAGPGELDSDAKGVLAMECPAGHHRLDSTVGFKFGQEPVVDFLLQSKGVSA